MAVFCSSRLDAYFLTIIAGIDNTERVASDFSNDYTDAHIFFKRHAQLDVNSTKPLRRMCGEPGVVPFIMVGHGRYAFRNAQLLSKEYACCDDNAYLLCKQYFLLWKEHMGRRK